MSAASAAGRTIARHWALLAACAIFLLVGALVVDDYGSWGAERYQRAIGRATLDYLAGDGERAFDQLLNPWDRYYGAAFEAPLVLVERILNPGDSRSIYLGRFLLTHLFWVGGGVFCYLLIHRLFNNRLLALIATVLFLLHPRIYAHSFFNSKDVPFLAMFMISLYLIHRAFRRDTLTAFLLCGVGVGLLVNLRIMGIVLFAAVLAMRALDLVTANRAQERWRVLLTGGAFALTAALAYYASLPALWTDPLGQGAEMARVLGAHPHATFNLFRGELLYSPNGPPFDYVPVWIGVTTPPATLLLALIGAFSLAWRSGRQPRDLLRNGPLRFGLLVLTLPVVTVTVIVVLENNLSNGWRQLYFLYAPLPLLAAFGLQWLLSSPHGRWMRGGAYGLAGGAVVVAIVSLVRIHPYQYDYFNALTDRTTPERLASRYALNYWDQSASVLADVIRDHPSGDIFVVIPFKGRSSRLFSAEDRARLVGGWEFQSGRNNFYQLRSQPCPAWPAASAYVNRIYANTLHCVVDPVAYFGEMRRRALTTEPLDRSLFTAHRVGDVLIYLRDGCTLAEARERVFLHVFPADPADLPPPSSEVSGYPGYAFERLDFSFSDLGVRIDGDCVAVAPLPDYPIARIRTGQYTAEYAEAVRRGLGDSEPWVRARYDIHFDPAERLLTYIREEGCAEGVGVGADFFLHVYPVDTDSLPAWRQAAGFSVLDNSLGGGGRTGDGACVVVAPLPAWPIASVHTGETGGWQVRFAVTRAEVDVVALGTPLARSVFDIHRDGDALVYVREGCTDVDAEARFGLHLYPVDADDLPDGRRAYGFANRDFFLGERGELEGGRCVAVVPLPAWPVASVHTGQYDGSGRRWWVEFALPGGE